MAAGCTIQELADLVFESGIAPPKTKDGITERYTLEDLGQKLWVTLQQTAKQERGAWFSALLPVQKTAVIVVLRDQGFRTEIIAKDLEVDPADVMRTWNAYASQLGSQVIGLRIDTIAGQLQMASERAQQMAIESGDHNAYWRIEKEKVETLQSIGIVERAIHRVEHTVKIDDAKKAEIEAIAALRNKQDRRKIELVELRQLDGKVEDLPAEVSKDYDDDEK